MGNRLLAGARFSSLEIGDSEYQGGLPLTGLSQ